MSTPTSQPNSLSAMTTITSAMFIIGILLALYQGDSALDGVNKVIFQSAKDAVTLALNLVGIMTFWLGVSKILEDASVLKNLANLLSPIICAIFPSIPKGHIAISSMTLNIAANMLGLGNASTPLGLKAMKDLQTLNAKPHTATDAMCMFLAINTSSVTILPLGVMSVLAASNASNPSKIILPSIITTSISTSVAIFAAIACRHVWSRYFSAKDEESGQENFGSKVSLSNNGLGEVTSGDEQDLPRMSLGGKLCLAIVPVAMIIVAANVVVRQSFSLEATLIPLILLTVICTGLAKGVNVYESLIEGGKEGFNVALKIIPFLVVIMVAISVFRESGALTPISQAISYGLGFIVDIPSQVVPMALIRPLSGSGAFAYFTNLAQNAPDAYETYLAGIMQGSSETTFYVLSLYFGSVGVSKLRYALIPALLADLAAAIASCVVGAVCWNLIF